MSEVINSTYEIIKEIGSGGMGNVYLARHLNLETNVVLKAAKKKVSELSRESRRREVDVLKELKHAYIPRVYDYFEYKDTVYTVMDFVEGESLDIPLKKIGRFSQPQVIQWAKQLLEALCYLHSPTHGEQHRGFVHGDIKPANIMQTPGGDICLIDFNVSLALGEPIAGYSPGYASPEHYRRDYSNVYDSQYDTSRKKSRTSRDRSGGASSEGGISGKKEIFPDARSDIYSLGATLYHLLSGVRPAADALDVVPLSDKEFSPQVVKIISKAMNPNPDLRYQTAEEMLDDFTHLRERDKRVRRRRRRNLCVYSLLLCLFAVGAAASFTGLKRMQVTEEWLKLAEYSRNALQEGDTAAAMEYALQTFPEKRSILQPDYIAESQRVLTEAAGLYDLADGYKIYETVELPSQPLFMKLSPDGKTAACVYAWSVRVIDTVTCETLAELPMEESALVEVEYLNDHTIIYAGKGGIRAYDIFEEKELWSGSQATAISVSGDGKSVAAVYRDEEMATVYDTSDGRILYRADFNGRHQRMVQDAIYSGANEDIFSLNYDGTLLGLSFSDGSLEIYDLADEDGRIILFDDTSGFIDFRGGFYQKYFAFSAVRSSGSTSFFGILDTESKAPTGDMDTYIDTVQVNENGIYIQQNNILVNLHPTTGVQTPLVNFSKQIGNFDTDGKHTVIAAKRDSSSPGEEKNSFRFFDENAELIGSFESEDSCDFVQIAQGTALVGSSNSPVVRILNYENHQENEIFSYDPSYIHDETRVSQDGKTIMMFTVKEFRLYDLQGRLISEVPIPDYQNVFDQQYIRDSEGSRLEVIYGDGKTVAYSAEDGSRLYEKQESVPDKKRINEFETDDFRIISPPDGFPQVYDRENGKLLYYLEKDDRLTYVTQIEEGIVAQYWSANRNYYGQLLNEKCEVIAELPYLCDVVDDTLIFDYPTGNIRQSSVYRIDEIIKFAKEQRGVKGNA